jgi:hypothetical protein
MRQGQRPLHPALARLGFHGSAAPIIGFDHQVVAVIEHVEWGKFEFWLRTAFTCNSMTRVVQPFLSGSLVLPKH